MVKMRSKLTFVLGILVVFGAASTLGISTGKKVTKADTELKDDHEDTVKDALPLPTPSPSPSTSIESAFTPEASDDTEFSSRLGTNNANATTPTDKKKLVNTSLKKPSPKYKTRNKKSPAATAASFKSSQVTYPENESGGSSPPEGSEGAPHQNEPQSDVQLELLDDKEGREGPDPRDSEERGKYPRIYYGEANPPQHPSYISAEEEEGRGGHLGKSHESDENGDHNQKYFYPKNYVHNKHAHKGGKNKKKYEYKYAEDVSRLEDPYRLHQGQNHGSGGRDESLTPDSQYNGPEDYLGKENTEGFTPESQGGSPDNYGYGHQNNGGGGGGPAHYGYHGRDISEIISKALHVLLPSALLLTGLSAVFPNRIHVPTNDRYYSNQNNLIRQKRSIDYNGQPYEILEPEHRSMSEEIVITPDAVPPQYRYNFEIGSPRGKYAHAEDQSKPSILNEFKEIPISAEVDSKSFIMSGDHKGYNRKTSGFLKNNIHTEQIEINRGQQYPDFTQYHMEVNHGSQSSMNFAENDSSFAPSSIATPTVVAPPNSLNSVDQSPPRPKRKMRTRTKIKVRQPNKRKSRPLPPLPEPVISNINDFQSKLIKTEKLPHRRQIMSRSSFKHQEKIDEQHAKGDFRMGDAYLKSIVEQHEMEKQAASNKPVDLSSDGAVMGLLTSYAEHDGDSPPCQKRALCELAIKGKNPNATKFETFLWSLASLVPEQFSKLYELDGIFKAVQDGNCEVFRCSRPNLDLQV